MQGLFFTGGIDGNQLLCLVLKNVNTLHTKVVNLSPAGGKAEEFPGFRAVIHCRTLSQMGKGFTMDSVIETDFHTD